MTSTWQTPEERRLKGKADRRTSCRNRDRLRTEGLDHDYDNDWVAGKARVDDSIYPDGTCIELSTKCSFGVSTDMRRLVCALREPPATEALRATVAEMIICIAALTAPDGSHPSSGDLHATEKVASHAAADIAEWGDLPWRPTVCGKTTDPVPPFTIWPRPDRRLGLETLP